MASSQASRHDVHVHIYEGDISSLERKLDQLMAKIDDLQATVDDLDVSVRNFMNNISSVESALQVEINKLRADDSVEDTVIDGLINTATNLRNAVETFGQEAPIDVVVDPPTPINPS